jgi:hypothetical protein
MMTPSRFENAHQAKAIAALPTDLHDVARKRRGRGQARRLKETHAIPIENLDLEGLIAVAVNGNSEE